MTTTERNDLLRQLFSRLDSLFLYEVQCINTDADSVSFRMSRKSRWDDYEYASVRFTFDELLDDSLVLNSDDTKRRFEEDLAREQAAERAAQERQAEAERRRQEAEAARPKPTKEQRERAELARLKALYET